MKLDEKKKKVAQKMKKPEYVKSKGLSGYDRYTKVNRYK